MDSLLPIKKCIAFVTDMSKKLFGTQNSSNLSTTSNNCPPKSQIQNTNFQQPPSKSSPFDKKFKQTLYNRKNQKSKFIGFDPLARPKSNPLRPSTIPYSQTNSKFQPLFTKQSNKHQAYKQKGPINERMQLQSPFICPQKKTKLAIEQKMQSQSPFIFSQNNRFQKIKGKKYQEQCKKFQIEPLLHINKKKIQPLSRNSPPSAITKIKPTYFTPNLKNELDERIQPAIPQFKLSQKQNQDVNQLQSIVQEQNQEGDIQLSKKQKKKAKKEEKQNKQQIQFQLQSSKKRKAIVTLSTQQQEIPLDPQSTQFRYEDGDDISSISQRSQTTDEIQHELLAFIHKKSSNSKIQQLKKNDIFIPNMKKKSGHQQGKTIPENNLGNKIDQNKNMANYQQKNKLSSISQQNHSLQTIQQKPQPQIKPKQKKCNFKLYPGQTIQQFKRRILIRYNPDDSSSNGQNSQNLENIQSSDSDQVINFNTKKLVKHQQYSRILNQLSNSFHQVMDEEQQRQRQASILIIQKMIDQSDNFSQIQSFIHRQFLKECNNVS